MGDLSRNYKVAFIVGKCQPGGVVSYAKGYAKELEKKGFSVYFCIEGEVEERYKTLLTEDLSRMRYLPSIKQLPKYINAYKALFEQERFDIVHGMLNTLNPFCMQAASRANVPMRISENLSTGHKLERKTIVKQLLKPIARMGCNVYAANSELAGRWLYGEDRMDKCFIMPNPIDGAIFHFESVTRNEERAKRGWDNKLVVGCVGRFEACKNYLKLIDVFECLHALMPETFLAIVGYGSKEKEIKDAVSAKGLTSCVEFFDSESNVAAFYNAIDVFVMTSLYEGMPIVALEAQASGAPCVLSSEITSECALSDGVRFVPLSETNQFWAEEILHVVGNADRSKIAESFKDSRFNAESAGNYLASLYEDFLMQYCA